MLTGNKKQIERSATARTATGGGTAYPTKPDRSRSHPFVDHDYDHDYDPATHVEVTVSTPSKIALYGRRRYPAASLTASGLCAAQLSGAADDLCAVVGRTAAITRLRHCEATKGIALIRRLTKGGGGGRLEAGSYELVITRRITH